MNNKIVGFGIVGTGGIANIHALAIKAIPNAQLIGVYSKASSEAFAQENNCVAYNSLEELLKADGLDIVCICTPSGIHADPAVQVIEAGKHCLIEKPLEVTLEKSDKIIEAAKKHNVTVAVVFPSRFYHSVSSLKNAIDTGRFGDLVMGSAYVKWSRTAEYYNSAAWRGTWEIDGGGALMNQGIHSVDMLQWCMGPVESVMAITGNIKHKNIEVEDTVVAILKFANGALGTIECSTAVYPGAFKKLEIMGTNGSVVINDNDIAEWQFSSKISGDESMTEQSGDVKSAGGVADPLSISYKGHQNQMEDLIEAISAGRRPIVDALEGRKSVEIVLAIYKSAKTGEMVRLPL